MAEEKRIQVEALAQELGIKVIDVVDFLLSQPDEGRLRKKLHSGSLLTEKDETLVRNKFDTTLDVQRVLISFDKKFHELGKTMSSIHQAKSLSEYIRGLIVLDALVSLGQVKSMNERDIPAWLLSEFPLPVLREFHKQYLSHKAVKTPGISL